MGSSADGFNSRPGRAEERTGELKCISEENIQIEAQKDRNYSNMFNWAPRGRVERQ